MKPLIEWTDQELVDELKFGHGVPELFVGTGKIMAELLRRERERCADAITEFCNQQFGNSPILNDDIHTCRTLVQIIRELK